MIRRSHAKLNLWLHVGAPQEAGEGRGRLHPIASWMAAIDLHDDVDIDAAPGAARLAGESLVLDRIRADDAIRPFEVDWPVENDLAFRAHQLLEHTSGRRLPARIRITKRIPPGGGLGGGSSNAATVLLMLNAAFRLGFSARDLARMSVRLGSDVAFFLDDLCNSPDADAPHAPRPALVWGFGDEVERLPVRSGQSDRAKGVMLIVPDFGCPTGAVYRALDEAPPRVECDLALVRQAATRGLGNASLENDLTEPAMRCNPRLRGIRDACESLLNRPVFMSGSGSTLFALGTSGHDELRDHEAKLQCRCRAALLY